MKRFSFIYIDKYGEGGSGYTIPCNSDENCTVNAIIINNEFVDINFIESNIVKWDVFPFGNAL